MTPVRFALPGSLFPIIFICCLGWSWSPSPRWLGCCQTDAQAKMFEKSDERILGDGDFIEQVLSAAAEQLEKYYRL